MRARLFFSVIALFLLGVATGCDVLDGPCAEGYWRPRAMEACVPVPVGEDAGLDAGSADAGSMDAAVDADVSDGAAMDADLDGSLDADVDADVDAAIPDAALSDGAAPDA